MSTIEERAPIAPDADQLLDDLHATLLRAEALWTDLSALLANGPANTTDPLAGFRTPAGTVCYTTRLASTVRRGEWVQACHGGDTGWMLVRSIVRAESSLALDDGAAEHGLRWWGPMDPIRVACTPGEAVACQGADRAEVAG